MKVTFGELEGSETFILATDLKSADPPPLFGKLDMEVCSPSGIICNAVEFPNLHPAFIGDTVEVIRVRL